MARKAQPSDIQHQLDSLQTKYRMMEINKQTFNNKKGDKPTPLRLLEQRQIQKLKFENERLKEDLTLETQQAKQANNMGAAQQIAKLQDQAEFYGRNIDMERKKLSDLERQLQKYESLAAEQRKEMGGINASSQKMKHMQKQIRVLENRLDKALVKFNEAMGHNKQLRETIDNLRRERIVFDGIYRKLENELREKKNKMAEIIDISNAAYEHRDKAQAEMIALKAQADKEQQNFEVEWSQLGQLIEQDRKTKMYLSDRDREGTFDDANQDALDLENKLKKRVSAVAWGVAKDKANIHLSMEKVQSYEEAFAKIQKATKITDIDELVQAFVNAEDTNFSLFNYVNDLSSEIEMVEEEITGLKSEIDKYQSQNVTDDQDRRKILASLEGDKEALAERVEVYEGDQEKITKTEETMTKGIESIFEKLNCNEEEGMDVLLTAGVTGNNIMDYLGVIEMRTNKLLETCKLYRKSEADKFDESQLAIPESVGEGEEEVEQEQEAAAEPQPEPGPEAVPEEEEPQEQEAAAEPQPEPEQSEEPAEEPAEEQKDGDDDAPAE